MKVIKQQHANAAEYLLIHHQVTLAPEKIIPLFEAKSIKGDDLTIKRPAGGRAGGKVSAIFFDYDAYQLVTKHYYRGGLIAKIVADKYLWLGLQSTRAYREMELLHYMHSQNLPVAEPFAAYIQQRGCYYRMDIITHRLEDALSLVELCKTKNHQQWGEVGRVIKLFHKHNIYHADLNAHNIIFANKRFYVIDFDRAKLCGGTSTRWKKRNLQRLYQSLQKLKKQDVIQFNRQDWQQLLAGYDAT